MIYISHLRKKFNDNYVLKDINLSLPRTGLVAIVGESGCGKTTLLNCLSGLLPYEGSINIDGTLLESLNEKDLDSYRLHNLGFVFQDFKLFENETVIRNVLLPFEMISNINKKNKIRKCKDLIKLVNLNRNINCLVNKLSGGEKQRCAIARSLVNDPKIILADEPTGALDYQNSIQIMEVLKKISSHSLVVMVTHDLEMAHRYASEIIHMKDGKVKEKKALDTNEIKCNLPISKNRFSNKKQSIPSEFLLHHTFTSIKLKKWRTFVCNIITSLGLIGVGLASTLSSSISTNIKKAYSSIIDSNKIIISLKDNGSKDYGRYAANLYEAETIKEENSDSIIDIGVCYKKNFDVFFKDTNHFSLTSSIYKYDIPSLHAQHINDFKWLDLEDEAVFYPSKPEALKDDEIVLALDYKLITEICYQLRIVKTVNSLSEYLTNHEVLFTFFVANLDWGYETEEVFSLKAFCLAKKPEIYHTNHKWNEYIFEERMKLLSNDSLYKTDFYPWTLKKIYYFMCNENRNNFLKITKNNESYSPFLFEIADSSYFPIRYENIDIDERKRILFFSNTQSEIAPQYISYYLNISKAISKPIFGSPSGYAIYPDNLMMGFSNQTLFSFDEIAFNESIDTFTSLSTETLQNISLPDGVMMGHYSKTKQNGVVFMPIDDKQYDNISQLSLDEIVVSSGLINNLGLNEQEALNQDIYIGSIYNDYVTDSGFVKRNYKVSKLRVSKIINATYNAIYHYSDWSLLFFQCKLGISVFDLLTTDISFELNEKEDNVEVIEKMNRALPNLKVSNPLNDINQSVDEVCFYIRIALLALSSLATIISILLLSMCNYLHIIENSKDIALARCIGATRRNASKFVYIHSVVMTFTSFLLSSFELFVTSFLINSMLGEKLSISSTFSFDPLALIYMFILALFISLMSSFVISKRISKLKPLDALKR